MGDLDAMKAGGRTSNLSSKTPEGNRPDDGSQLVHSQSSDRRTPTMGKMVAKTLISSDRGVT